MPKILRIANRFNLGGPTFNVAYLTKYLAPEFETLLVGGDKDDNEESSTFILDQLGITPTIIPEMKRNIDFKNDYRAYQKLRQIIREFKPDIVHTHASKSGTLGRLAAIHEGVPLMFHTFHGHVFHSYFGTLKTQMYKMIERYLAKKSTKIIAISPLQKQELVDAHGIVSEDKVKVIPLGFDLSRFAENQAEKRKAFRKRYQISDDKIAIGIVGRLVPIKNHRLFVDIIEILQKQNPGKYVGIIVGDGEDKEILEEYIKSKGIDLVYAEPRYADIIMTSWIKAVDEVYAGLDLVLMTSFNEGTPVSLIEAQVSGKYVISTNVGGVRDIIMEGKTGDVVSGFHPHDFAAIVSKKVHFSPSKEDSLQIREKYSFTRLVSDMAQLYRDELRNVKK